MSDSPFRFTIDWRYARRGGGTGWVAGWVVLDRNTVITIPFEEEAEALQHRDRIAAAYLRYGW